MGRMDEYAWSGDDGFGTFLGRTCYWKVSHTFEQGSSQSHPLRAADHRSPKADDQTRGRHVFRIGSMPGTTLPFCDRSLYTAIG